MHKTIDTYTVKGVGAVLALAHLTLYRERDREESEYHLKKAIQILTDTIRDSCDTETEFLATTATACGMAYADYEKEAHA